jgi:hypothetical protein
MSRYEQVGTDVCGLCIHYKVHSYRHSTLGLVDTCDLFRENPKIIHHWSPACDKKERVPQIDLKALRAGGIGMDMMS